MRSEKKYILVGMILVVIYIATLLISTWQNPIFGQKLLTLTASRLVAGRIIGMYTGYVAGLSHLWIIILDLLIEVAWVCIAFPLVKKGWSLLKEKNSFEKINQASNNFSKRLKEKKQISQILLLWIFVFMPIPLTGPVVGTLVGYELGLRPLITLTSVFSSVFITVFISAFFLTELHNIATSFNESAPLWLLAGMIFIYICSKKFFKKA